jgi:hypothetical protein
MYGARTFSVTETRLYAQFNRALSVSWVEPRKRNGVAKTFAPLRVSDGYCLIEVDGKFVYDSRADIRTTTPPHRLPYQAHGIASAHGLTIRLNPWVRALAAIRVVDARGGQAMPSLRLGWWSRLPTRYGTGTGS